ncbi:hypothetical protein Scep_017704 [Stephania cephalantha]|uniref:Peroxidase n=1 Tax=Stephania cephalantha TaxID=152367 RepID=A0AAP0IS02_9MAGN
MMAFSPLQLFSISILLVLLIFISDSGVECRLSTNYYSKSCPNLATIVGNVVTDKQIRSPTTAAGTLRLFFHDCLVSGCDASVLISSTAFNRAERDADINLSLPGDAFDVVVRAKTAVELQCPGVVSCADILALAARDLVVMAGGPFYNLQLGRRDGVTSSVSSVESNIPKPTMPMTQLINLFASKGFSIQEMVALTGAHTIGFSHCKEFAYRVFNYSKSASVDPTLNPKFAEALKGACANYGSNPTTSVFNDVMTPSKFDNVYYQNLGRGLGLLASDRGMIADARTRGYAEIYASNQSAFFEAFGRAMEKLSVREVKVGGVGEIRRRCDAFNG